MKLLSLFSIVIILTTNLHAQTINEEIFRKNVDILFTAADDGFKDIRKEASGKTDDGMEKYHSSRKVSGAKDVYIKVDDEDSHTYIALFEYEDMETAKKALEKMASLVAEQTADKGLVRKKGTEIRYEGYRKQTIEFDSDNIDEMGKHPSFELGIIKGSEPPTVEMVVNEPLWK